MHCATEWERMNKEQIQVGNRVLFVGGPEAGNVRIIPESHGDFVKTDDDTWVYRIWPTRMAGDKRTLYFAYDAQRHPIEMYLEMWREYSPAAQIQRGAREALTYNKIGQNK